MHRTGQDALHVITPEGIVFPLHLAGAAPRFLAWLLDSVCSMLITWGVAQATSLVFVFTPDLLAAVNIILFFLVAFGYRICLEWFWQGKTVGKFLLGLRVVDVQGLRIHFSQVFIRNLLRVVDSLPAMYFVGGAALVISPMRQRLGDLAANTVVVRNHAPLRPDMEQLLPGKYNSFRAYPHIEAKLRQQVEPDEASLLVRALVRRDTLEPEGRVRLYSELASHFRPKAAFPQEALVGLSDEQFLRNVADSIFRPSANTAPD